MGCGSSKEQKGGTANPKKSTKANQVAAESSVVDPACKPIIIFIAGGPGCGKGTQCAKIVADYGYHHISTGEILRKETEGGGPDSEELKNIMKAGNLVPSSLLVKLIKKTIKSMNKKKDVFLLDGFPRNIDNITEWDKQIGKFAEVKFLLNFECSNETMTARILERSKENAREDDNPDVIKNRLDVFQKETQPVLDNFKSKGKVVGISVEKEPEAIYQQIQETLKKWGMNKMVIKKAPEEESDDEEDKKDDEEEEKKVQIIKPPPKIEVSNEDRKKRAKILFFTGPPASGKKYQVERLSDKFLFTHIKTEKVLEKGEGYKENGEEVSAESTVNLLVKELENSKDNQYVVITGFPQNSGHMEAWNSLAGSNSKIVGVVHLDVDLALAAKRKGMKKEELKSQFDKYSSEFSKIEQYLEDEDLLINVESEDDKYRTTVTLQRIFENIGVMDKEKLKEERKKLPKLYVVIGGPGSKKKTYTKLACKDSKVQAIDTRNLLKEMSEENSEIGRKLDQAFDNGDPISTQLKLEALTAGIEKLNNEGGKKFALLGFPKNLEEAEALISWNKFVLKKVVLMDCKEKKMKKYMLKYIDEEKANTKISKWATVKAAYTLTFKKSGNPIKKFDANGTIHKIVPKLKKSLSRYGK